MKKCQHCGREDDLQKHHIAYEPVEMTIWICRDCHGDIHSMDGKVGMPRGVDMDEYNRKTPYSNTGTMSLYNTKDDREIVNNLGWIKIGASPLYSKALEEAEKNKRLKKKREQFYEGRITLGELMKELNKL